MLILVHGKDSYQIHNKIKEIISRHKGRFVFIKEKRDIENLRIEISQDSIFKEKKLVVLENLWSLISQEKKIVQLLKNIKDSKEITIVFKEEKMDKKTESFFKEKGEVFLFDFLAGRDLASWIQKEIHRKGGEIRGEALAFLTESVGNDLWLASNEIEKLLTYKKGVIEEKDVALLVPPLIEGDVFKAIDFLSSGNRKAAFDVLYKRIKKGDHVLYLIKMIVFQFRNLILVKTNPGSDNRNLGMHPFVFRKSVSQSRRFSESQLREIYARILETEIDIKTGKADPGSALDFLVFETK